MYIPGVNILYIVIWVFQYNSNFLHFLAQYTVLKMRKPKNWKPVQGKWSQDAMGKAARDVKEGKLGIRRAALTWSSKVDLAAQNKEWDHRHTCLPTTSLHTDWGGQVVWTCLGDGENVIWSHHWWRLPSGVWNGWGSRYPQPFQQRQEKGRVWLVPRISQPAPRFITTETRSSLSRATYA